MQDRAVGSPWEVFWAFLKLGVTCFGGPIAHIGYFHNEFVVRRRWLDEATYAELVGLCQFLPGPASSQVGFSIGLIRAGYRGGLAAWSGFTLPSAVLMVLCAYGASAVAVPIASTLLHGLKLAAVAAVAHAVWVMARALCPDRPRLLIAVLAMSIVLASSSSFVQLGAIALGGILGLSLCAAEGCRQTASIRMPVSRQVGMAALGGFFLLLIALPILGTLSRSPAVTLFGAFYRSGALVFGGGHVVLPLLRQAFVGTGWVSEGVFLAGYGAAQALPGPLFTFAAYLGTIVRIEPHGLTGAALGLIGIFLPGMLILLGTLPFWKIVQQRTFAQAAMRGVNAAVVGLLAAALYNPVWTSSVHTAGDFLIALTGFVLLAALRAPPVLVVIVAAIGAIALAYIRL